MRVKKMFVLFTVLTAVVTLVFTVTAKAKTNTSTLTKSMTKQKAGVEKMAGQAAETMKGKININKVDLDTLTQLKGIGPEKAKAILDYRKKFGSFKKIEDLMKVKGIGEKTFNMIKPFLTL